jgi:flagellar hook-associated protein 1 FlgK
MSTEELRDAFAWLDDAALVESMVVTTPLMMADSIDTFDLFPSTLYTPRDDFFASSGIPSINHQVETMVRTAATARYSKQLPAKVHARVEEELSTIISRGFANVYYLSHVIVKQSLEHGYLVGSRGSVGSSLVATLMDITVNENPEGLYDVFVGSTPIVLGTRNRGLEIQRETINGLVTVTPRLKDNGAPLNVKSGSLGGLLQSRAGAIDATIEKIDRLASQLIFEVNKLHSTGTNADGLTAATGTLAISSANRNLAISDPNNTTFANLPFSAQTGGFFVEVRNKNTGTSDRVWIEVDLDGIDANGLPGTGDDTTPQNILDAINAVEGLTATFTPDGRLDIASSPGFSFSFDDDSSGILAVLGVNSFFTGTTAQDINVRDGVEVMLGRFVDGQFVENANAKMIGELADRSLSALGGQSVGRFWSLHAQDVATQSSSARVGADASTIVRESLEAQRAAVSGVSIDEESMNLLTFQRQYQAAAQIVKITQSMFDTLLNLV